MLPNGRWMQKICARPGCGRRFFACSSGTPELDAQCFCSFGCFTHRHDRREVVRRLDG